MVRAREGDVAARRAHGVGDCLAVGGDHAVIGDAELRDAFPDPHHERPAGERAQRLVGQPRSAEAGRDDGQQAHAFRVRMQISRQPR
jgi:hypothetical protein